MISFAIKSRVKICGFLTSKEKITLIGNLDIKLKTPTEQYCY